MLAQMTVCCIGRNMRIRMNMVYHTSEMSLLEWYNEKLTLEFIYSNGFLQSGESSSWNYYGILHSSELSYNDSRTKAFLVTVRNKKRVGYTYELTLKLKGEWLVKEESKTIEGHIDIPEFSFGELEDLQACAVK